MICMKIDELMQSLKKLKDSGVEEVFLERASIMENVVNDFRSGYIWLDGYDCENNYLQPIEIEIEI